MNPSMPWFRMYTDFLNDPKMIALAFEDQRHFIGILALKSDGALDQDCNPDLLDRIVAQRLWIDHAIIRDVKKRLIAAGLIDAGWQPLAWNKRQMRSDTDSTAAERKRRQREREKAAQSPAQQQKTEPENNVTDASRVTVTNVTRLDTDTDIDKETDKEQKTKPRASAGAPAFDFSTWPTEPSPEVFADYLLHRKQIKAPLTQTAANRLGAEAHRALAMGYSVDDFLAECMLRGWKGGKAGWLENKTQSAGGNQRSASQAQRNADWTANLWAGAPAPSNEIDMGVIDATAN